MIADPAALRAYGLAEADVTAALAGANVLSAAGKLEDRGKLYLVLNDSALTSAAQIAAVVVKSTGGGVVRLGDVATVRTTSAPACLPRDRRRPSRGQRAGLPAAWRRHGPYRRGGAASVRQGARHRRRPA